MAAPLPPASEDLADFGTLLLGLVFCKPAGWDRQECTAHPSNPLPAARSQVREAESLWALAELGKRAYACGISREGDVADVVNYQLMCVIVACFLLKDRLQGDIKKQQ